MMKRASVFIFGAALFASAALVLSAAGYPAQAQSSTTKSATPSTGKKKKTSSKYRKKSRTRAQAAPTPDRIKEIQAALQKDGSYTGEPTGKWDPATMDAMRKFQDKNGFAPTGKIDAVSLNKLGLGSETAGKGAPIPATSPAPAAATPTAATSTTADPAPIPAADSPAK
jgi:peptidoglycan hydrolase-like protein with peptidoglycan-binding domain